MKEVLRGGLQVLRYALRHVETLGSTKFTIKFTTKISLGNACVEKVLFGLTKAREMLLLCQQEMRVRIFHNAGCQYGNGGLMCAATRHACVCWQRSEQTSVSDTLNYGHKG